VCFRDYYEKLEYEKNPEKFKQENAPQRDFDLKAGEKVQIGGGGQKPKPKPKTKGVYSLAPPPEEEKDNK